MSGSKTILLMRHGEAGAGQAGDPDQGRKLTERGVEEARQMGKRLRAADLVPDYLLVSTARRALETAEAFAQTSEFGGQLSVAERLYLAEPDAYFDLFTEITLGTRRLLIVAHNPGIADLVELISGKHVHMCTAGIARIDFDVEDIAALKPISRGRLVEFFRPALD